MSLHLGNDFSISSKQVVGIFNLHNVTPQDVLGRAWERPSGIERVRKIGPGPYHAAVICERGAVYLSPMEAVTLARRFKRVHQPKGW